MLGTLFPHTYAISLISTLGIVCTAEKNKVIELTAKEQKMDNQFHNTFEKEPIFLHTWFKHAEHLKKPMNIVEVDYAAGAIQEFSLTHIVPA